MDSRPEKTFHGVDLGWMQAQWRDCKNRKRQMAIFRDMTRATEGEILEALGDSGGGVNDPLSARRGKRFTAAETETLLRLRGEGLTWTQISEQMGRPASSLEVKYLKLKKKFPQEQSSQVPTPIESVRDYMEQLVGRREDLRRQLGEVETEIADYTKLLDGIIRMPQGGNAAHSAATIPW